MIESVSGVWAPLYFVTVIVALYAFFALISKLFPEKQRVVDPFVSGMIVEGTVPASSLYWGFVRALREYYDVVVKWHSGLVNDYVAWFVGTLAIMFIIFFIGGMM